MIKSINIHNDNVMILIEKYGYSKFINPKNYFYTSFRIGMSFQRLPNGKILYYVPNQMY